METTTSDVYQRVLEEAVRRLVAALRPERIYLFGSQARGEANEESDYDLMVIVPESGQTRYGRVVEAYGLLSDLPIGKDLLVWTRDEFERQVPVAASLPATVLREGRLLYAAGCMGPPPPHGTTT